MLLLTSFAVTKYAASANQPGTSGTVTVNPCSPPSVSWKYRAIPGTATASASVAPAMYGPCSLAAATPTPAPITRVTTVATSNTTRIGGALSRSDSSNAVVYAPIAMNAPCPSDNCPFSPVNTVSPPAAIPM